MLLRSQREGIDCSSATGRMLAGIFAALAAERELVRSFGGSRATIHRAPQQDALAAAPMSA